jgi:hypothetical protein
MGNTARVLNSLAFYVASSNGTYSGLSISLTHTAASDLSTTFTNNYGGNQPTVVFSRSSYALNSSPAGWKAMTFDQKFAYNGTDNLLVEIRWTAGAGVMQTSRTSESGWKRTLLGTSVTASTGSRQSFRNILQFTDTADAVYTISGTIRDINNVAVSGARLLGLPGVPHTDTNGFYSAVVVAGWSGSAVPLLNNHIFDPGSITYSSVSANRSQQDYTAFSTAGVESKTASATYSSGDIPTDINFQTLPGTSSSPGSLVVTLPSDAIITGTDVTYKMTAQNSGYMSEQRSWLRCIASGGIGEPEITSGIGNSTGTYTYTRSNVYVANAVRGGGNVTFQLHAGRTWGGSGANTTYSKVDNNSWQVTVKYVQMSLIPPIKVSTGALEITEGQTGQLLVSLGKVPESNVSLNVIRLSGSTNIVVQTPMPIVFSPANGTNALPVTIYAGPDLNWTNDVAVFVCRDVAGNYPDSPLVTVTEIDIDIDPSRILPFAENFDDAGKASTLGVLDGQHGWQANAGASVVASSGVGNSKVLRLASGHAEHDFVNGTNVVAISAWVKPVGAEDPGTPPAGVTAVFWVDTNNFVRVYNGNTMVALPIQVDTNAYNHFQAWVDYNANTWRLDINGTMAFQDYATYANNDAFTKIRLEQGTAEPAYFDNIQISSAAAPPVEFSEFEQWLIANGMPPSTCGTTPCASGAHTLHEAYIAGINPMDAEARFEIKQTSLAAGNNFALQWQGVEGRRYNVYWSSNLLHGAGFQLIASNLPYTVNSVTNTMTNGKGYYRISVQME